MSNHPAHKIRVGYVSATIWKNPGDNGIGFYSIEIQRTYRASDGNLANTSSLGYSEIFLAKRALQLAAEWIEANPTA
jgi:hypothetical protein